MRRGWRVVAAVAAVAALAAAAGRAGHRRWRRWGSAAAEAQTAVWVHGDVQSAEHMPAPRDLFAACHWAMVDLDFPVEQETLYDHIAVHPRCGRRASPAPPGSPGPPSPSGMPRKGRRDGTRSADCTSPCTHTAVCACAAVVPTVAGAGGPHETPPRPVPPPPPPPPPLASLASSATPGGCRFRPDDSTITR